MSTIPYVAEPGPDYDIAGESDNSPGSVCRDRRRGGPSQTKAWTRATIGFQLGATPAPNNRRRRRSRSRRRRGAESGRFSRCRALRLGHSAGLAARADAVAGARASRARLVWAMATNSAPTISAVGVVSYSNRLRDSATPAP
jgi:hypothetical protein